jgi:16S rRNA processing protein RimM
LTIEVLVGRIGKPHGIRGEVTIDVRSDEPERRFAPGSSLISRAPKGSAFPYERLTIESARWHQQVLLIAFDELTDRTAAEGARGTLLYATVAEDESPEDPDEYYDHQLVGLAVHDLEGRPLGTVSAVVHGGAQDLLTVRRPDGGDGLVPFVKALVPEVDVAGGRVVVADRPGLVTPLPEDTEDTEGTPR